MRRPRFRIHRDWEVRQYFFKNKTNILLAMAALVGVFALKKLLSNLIHRSLVKQINSRLEKPTIRNILAALQEALLIFYMQANLFKFQMLQIDPLCRFGLRYHINRSQLISTEYSYILKTVYQKFDISQKMLVIACEEVYHQDESLRNQYQRLQKMLNQAEEGKLQLNYQGALLGSKQTKRTLKRILIGTLRCAAEQFQQLRARGSRMNLFSPNFYRSIARGESAKQIKRILSEEITIEPTQPKVLVLEGAITHYLAEQPQLMSQYLETLRNIKQTECRNSGIYCKRTRMIEKKGWNMDRV